MEHTGFSVPNSADVSEATIASSGSIQPTPEKAQKRLDGSRGMPSTLVPSKALAPVRTGPKAVAVGAPSVPVVSGTQGTDVISVKSHASISSSANSSQLALLKLAGDALAKEEHIAKVQLAVIQNKIAIADLKSDRGSVCSARSTTSQRKSQRGGSAFEPDLMDEPASEQELTRRAARASGSLAAIKLGVGSADRANGGSADLERRSLALRANGGRGSKQDGHP